MHLRPAHEAPSPRTRGAWRAWLVALGTSAEAALAASMAYEVLDSEGRDAWLSALEEDAAAMPGPRLGFLAPLLGVEEEGDRRARLIDLLGHERIGKAELRAYRAEGTRYPTHVVLVPLYLDFVSMLGFASSDRGFEDVTEERFLPSVQALARAASALATTRWVSVTADSAIDDLARAILASRRARRAVPGGLAAFAHLLTPVRSSLAA